jgi:hypothetical protein
MTGIATGSIGTEGHAVAKPLQAKKRALARLGSDCDRALDLPLPSMCDSAAAARHGYTAPLRRGCARLCCAPALLRPAIALPASSSY